MDGEAILKNIKEAAKTLEDIERKSDERINAFFKESGFSPDTHDLLINANIVEERITHKSVKFVHNLPPTHAAVFLKKLELFNTVNLRD